MYQIEILDYDEGLDAFNVFVNKQYSDAYRTRIPAFLMPFIAKPLLDECDDIPFDLVGKTFEMHL